MWRLINPFEAAVAAAAALIGLAGLLGDTDPSSTLTAIWGGNAWLYFVLLLVGGVATLIGIGATLFKRVDEGRNMWIGGLVGILSAWGTYGVALMITGSAATAAGLLVVLSLATLVRIIQLYKSRSSK